MEPDGHLPVAAAADAHEAAIGRTRTFFVFITGADAGEQESVRICTEERDWENLLPGIVSKVAKFALRSDVVDYIRLRAVCSPWRGAAIPDPKLMGMDPRYFPRNWDILKWDARGDRARFENCTGGSIWLQIPPEYGEVIARAEGCLILASAEGCTQKLRLFNPVTRAVAFLPAIPCGGVVNAAGFVYDGNGEANADITVVLCAVDEDGNGRKLIVYAKPGDSMWGIVRDQGSGELVPYSEGGLSVRGRFYVPTPTGDVRKLELLPQPHLVYVARQEARHRRGSSIGVTSRLEQDVDDPDDGMLLLRFIADNVEVFRVNLTDGMGSLTLVEDQEDLDGVLHPTLTLGSKSSD